MTGGKPVSDVLIASEKMRLAFPEKHPREKHARRIWRAYRVLQNISQHMGMDSHWTLRRARSIWNDEARLIKHHEMEVIKNAEKITAAAKDYQDLSGLRKRLEARNPRPAGHEIETIRKMELQARRYYRAVKGQIEGW